MEITAGCCFPKSTAKRSILSILPVTTVAMRPNLNGETRWQRSAKNTRQKSVKSTISPDLIFKD